MSEYRQEAPPAMVRTEKIRREERRQDVVENTDKAEETAPPPKKAKGPAGVPPDQEENVGDGRKENAGNAAENAGKEPWKDDVENAGKEDWKVVTGRRVMLREENGATSKAAPFLLPAKAMPTKRK